MRDDTASPNARAFVGPLELKLAFRLTILVSMLLPLFVLADLYAVRWYIVRLPPGASSSDGTPTIIDESTLAVVALFILLSPLGLVATTLLPASSWLARKFRLNRFPREILVQTRRYPVWPGFAGLGLSIAALLLVTFVRVRGELVVSAALALWLPVAGTFVFLQLGSTYVVRWQAPQLSLQDSELTLRPLGGSTIEGAQLMTAQDDAGDGVLLGVLANDRRLTLRPWRAGSLGRDDANDALRFLRLESSSSETRSDWQLVETVTLRHSQDYRVARLELPDLSGMARKSDIIFSLLGAAVLAILIGLHLGALARTWTEGLSARYETLPRFMSTRSWRFVGTWELTSGCAAAWLAWPIMRWARQQRARWGDRSQRARLAVREVVVFTRADLPRWPLWVGTSLTAVGCGCAGFEILPMLVGPLLPLVWAPLLVGGLVRLRHAWGSLRILEANAGGTTLRRPFGRPEPVDKVEQRGDQLRLTTDQMLIVH